jgi:hypothetical protein
MRRFPVSVLVLVLSFASSLQAGTWGERGVPKQFLAADSRLFAADGRGVTVYDLDDPALRRLDVASIDDESTSVAKLGASALLLGTTHGIARFDIHDNSALALRGTWDRDGGIEHVAANDAAAVASAGQTLFFLRPKGDSLEQTGTRMFHDRVLSLAATATHFFVAVEREGIFAFDAGSLQETVAVPVASVAIAIDGTTLWSVDSVGGLIAIDISDGAAPAILSTTDANAGVPADGVAASGKRVYVFDAPDTIRFYDATDITAPRLAATRTEWVNVIAAHGNSLYFSGPRLDRDRFTYETGLPLRAIDASTLSEPVISAEVHDLAGPVSGVWTDGSIAYVVDAPYFRVLDVSKSDEPKELAALQLPMDAPQLRVRVKNGKAFVYGRDFVHLIDVADPLHPRFDVTWNPRGHSPDDVAPMADGLFVEVNQHSGVHVVDYAKYNPPAQVGGRIMDWRAVAAGDDALYILSSVMLVMSVTDRAKAQDEEVIVAHGRTVETAPPNADRPPLLVLAQGTGVRLYSLTENRFHPVVKAFVPLADPREMGTTADAVVVDSHDSLYRLDLASPDEFEPLGLRVTSAQQISVAAGKIVVADRYRVRVYGPDTAPPPQPETSKRRAVGR